VVSRHIVLRLSIITAAATSLAVDYARLLLDYIYNNVSSLHTKYAGDMLVSHIYISLCRHNIQEIHSLIEVSEFIKNVK
jgi:hypothetical protein